MLEGEPGKRAQPAQAGSVPEAPVDVSEPTGRRGAETLHRAQVLSAGTLAEPGRAERVRLTPATLVALLLLAVSAGGSVVYVAARGGVTLPSSPPGSPPAAAGNPSLMPSPRASPPAGPTAGPSIRPAPSGTFLATPAPSPAATVVPSPTSDRYAVLVVCPGAADCWMYTIRRGDNLVSIANWFGIPLARIYDMNPGLRGTTIQAGMEIRIPTPTR